MEYHKQPRSNDNDKMASFDSQKNSREKTQMLTLRLSMFSHGVNVN